MSEFSDRPFVAGSLIGLRSFAVDGMGRLTGPAYGHVFRPGENQAQCHKDQYADGPLFWTGGVPVVRRPSAPKKQDVQHTAGKKGCSCGFYAYFDGGNDYDKPERVTAIIEGYGVCTVGTRGFRAEKAKLVALVIPGTRRRDYACTAAMALLCMANIAFGTQDAFQHSWISLAISVVATAASGWSTWFYARRTLRARKSAASFQAVLRNYAEVPTYRSVKAALRDHPLTPPPAPTPETDDDFWTRSA